MTHQQLSFWLAAAEEKVVNIWFNTWRHHVVKLVEELWMFSPEAGDEGEKPCDPVSCWFTLCRSKIMLDHPPYSVVLLVPRWVRSADSTTISVCESSVHNINHWSTSCPRWLVTHLQLCFWLAADRTGGWSRGFQVKQGEETAAAVMRVSVGPFVSCRETLMCFFSHLTGRY